MVMQYRSILPVKVMFIVLFKYKIAEIRAPDLYEAFIEREVVTYRVLPALFVVTIIGETPHDEIIYAAQRCSLIGGTCDGHGDEGDVGVGGLDGGVSPPLGVDRGAQGGGVVRVG